MLLIKFLHSTLQSWELHLFMFSSSHHVWMYCSPGELIVTVRRGICNRNIKLGCFCYIVGMLAWENLHFGIQSWNFQEIISMLLETNLDPKPKKIDSQKVAYLINYSLKWLIYLENHLSSEDVRLLILIKRPTFLL